MKYIFLLICLHLTLFANAQFTQIQLHGGKITGLVQNKGKFIAASSGSGIFISDTAVVDWKPSNKGLLDREITSLSLFNDTLYASADTLVYRSTDNGTTWTEIFRNTGLNKIEQFIKTPGGMYVLNNSTVKSSSDGGATWRFALQKPDIRLPACNNGDTLYVTQSSIVHVVYSPSSTTFISLTYSLNREHRHFIKIGHHSILYADGIEILHLFFSKRDTTKINVKNPGYRFNQFFTSNGMVYATLEGISNSSIRILQSADSGATWSYHSTLSQSLSVPKGMVWTGNKLLIACLNSDIYSTGYNDTIWTRTVRNMNGFPVLSFDKTEKATSIVTSLKYNLYLAPNQSQWNLIRGIGPWPVNINSYLVNDSLYMISDASINRWNNTLKTWQIIAYNGYVTASCRYKWQDFHLFEFSKSFGYGNGFDPSNRMFYERIDRIPENAIVTSMTKGLEDEDLFGTLKGGGIIQLRHVKNYPVVVKTVDLKKILSASGYIYGIPVSDKDTMIRVVKYFDSTTVYDHITSNFPEQGWADIFIDEQETVYLLHKSGKVYYSTNFGQDWVTMNTTGLPEDIYTTIFILNNTIYIGTRSNFFFYNSMSNALGDNSPALKRNDFTVYPNPFKNKIQLTSNSTIERISISDIMGKTVYMSRESSNNSTIDLSSMPVGVYFVNVRDSEGESRTIKVIRE